MSRDPLLPDRHNPLGWKYRKYVSLRHEYNCKFATTTSADLAEVLLPTFEKPHFESLRHPVFRDDVSLNDVERMRSHEEGTGSARKIYYI